MTSKIEMAEPSSVPDSGPPASCPFPRPPGSVLSDLRNNSVNPDFHLVSAEDGTEVGCHRLILGARSPVLAKMIDDTDGGWKEGQNRRTTIEGVSGPDLVMFVKFLYTDEVEDILEQDTLETFLELGEKYELDILKWVAESRLFLSLAAENCVHFLLLGDLYRARDLKSSAEEKIVDHLDDVLKTEEWKELVKRRPELMAGVIEAINEKQNRQKTESSVESITVKSMNMDAIKTETMTMYHGLADIMQVHVNESPIRIRRISHDDCESE